MEKELNLIVRIANKDLNGKLSIPRAIMDLKGINHRIANIVAKIFEKQTKTKNDSKIGMLSDEMVKKLEDIILNPGKYGIPVWALNRQKDFETGENMHLIMGDLQFGLRKDLQRLGKIKSYRGLRHAWQLPVRGQRTKSTHRGKGGVVGVMKKDAKKGTGVKK